MKISSNVACTADTRSAEFQPAGRKNNEVPVVAMLCVGSACLVSTVGLLLWAFNAVPSSEMASSPCIDAVDSVGSETLQTLLMFALGYISMLVARRRVYLANEAYRMLCIVNRGAAGMCSACASAIAAVTNVRQRSLPFQQPAWLNQGVMAIVAGSMLCTMCIVGLLVSAFAAEPDQDPTEIGLASESSTFMRVFTVGWMFILSFKLRRELVALVGSGCLLQPW